jgi:hypothetical protein
MLIVISKDMNRALGVLRAPEFNIEGRFHEPSQVRCH